MHDETSMLGVGGADGPTHLEAISTMNLVAELKRRENITMDRAISAALPFVSDAVTGAVRVRGSG